MANVRLTSKHALTYAAGTAASPQSAESHPVFNLNYMTRKQNQVGARPSVGSYQPSHSVPGDEYCEVSFVMQLFGQRATGEPWTGMRLMEACGCDAAGSTAFTSTVGDPHEDGDTPDGVTEPVALTNNIDGFQHIAAGCVGSWRLDVAAGDIPTMSFNFTGSNSVSAASAGTETSQAAYASAVYPVRAAAGLFTIGGVTLVCPSFFYDLNNTITPRMDVNGVEGRSQGKIVGRAPFGQAIVEVPLIATYNPETLAFAKTKASQAFSYTHNNVGTAFDEILFTWTAYIMNVDLTDIGGRLHWVIDFTQDYSTGAFAAAWSDN